MTFVLLKCFVIWAGVHLLQIKNYCNVLYNMAIRRPIQKVLSAILIGRGDLGSCERVFKLVEVTQPTRSNP